jgi:hypothetical protein
MSAPMRIRRRHSPEEALALVSSMPLSIDKGVMQDSMTISDKVLANWRTAQLASRTL